MPESLFHCRVCAIEFQAEYNHGDEDLVECVNTGPHHDVQRGDLEDCGTCSMCGRDRDPSDTDWHIEDWSDMTCLACMEDI